MTKPDPWVDLQGQTQVGICGKTQDAFDNCMMCHLKTHFPVKAAEMQRDYLFFAVQKPQCMSIHQFVDHLEQLNLYILLLPCWWYSPSHMPVVEKINECIKPLDFLAIILKAVPESWHEKYYLTFDPVAENKDMLLKSLEKIEKDLGGKKLKKGRTN